MTRTIYIDNLKDKQKKRYISEKIEVLAPQEIFEEKLQDTDALIVLCELNSDKDGYKINRSDFYGVKLVQELRRNKFMGKVLFVSFIEEQYIVKNKLGEIIKSIGHSFTRLPSSVKEWNKELKTVLKLDKLSYYDIINHFSGENKIISEKIHSIESKIILKTTLSKEDKDPCIQIIKSAYAAKQRNVESTLKNFEEITDGENAIQFVKNKCYTLFPKDDKTPLEKLKPEWSKWKVLWLDDEETDESPLKIELEKRGKLKVELVKTYQEAIDTWEKDVKTTQEVCLVIADYRLNDKKDTCKKKQGYHFLQYIADKNAGVGLIAYSGLTRRFLFESFKHYGVQVNIFSKIDFNQENDNNIEYLADQIIQLGDNHWMMRNNQPQSTVWSNEISLNYFIFKESIDYYSFEQILSKQVRQNLDVFIANFKKCSSKAGLWCLTFTDAFKVRTGKFPNGTKEIKIEAVKEVLTIRRFAIGLFAFLKSDKNKQSNLLTEDNYLNYLKFIIYNSDNSKNNSVKWNNTNFDNFIKELKKNPSLKNTTSKSGLTFDSSWPYGLLPEEYAWLECDSGLGVTYLSDNRNYWSKIESLRNIFKDNFSKSPFLKTVLVEGKISFDNKTVYFNDDFEPFFRSVVEIKGVLITIRQKLDAENTNYETQLTEFILLLRSILREIEKEENTPANIKTLVHFIKEIRKVSNNLPEEIKYIDEEYSFLFAPWEFRVSRSNRYKTSYSAHLKQIKENCLKSINNPKTEFILKHQDNNTLPYFDIYTNNLKKEEELNLMIYKAIVESNKHRNTAITKIYSHIESNSKEDPIKTAESINASGSKYISDSDYILLPEVMQKLKKQLGLTTEQVINELNPKYFSFECFNSLCSSIGLENEFKSNNYLHIVMFSYNTENHYDIDNLPNNLSNDNETAILAYS